MLPILPKAGRPIVSTPRHSTERSTPLTARRLATRSGRSCRPFRREQSTTTRQFTLAIARRRSTRPCARAREAPCRGDAAGSPAYRRHRYLSVVRRYRRTKVDAAIIAVAEKGPGVHTTSLYLAESVLVARRGHPRVPLPASLVDVLGERLRLQAIKAPAPRLTTEIKLVWHRTGDDPAMSAFRHAIVRGSRGVRRR